MVCFNSFNSFLYFFLFNYYIIIMVSQEPLVILKGQHREQTYLEKMLKRKL